MNFQAVVRGLVVLLISSTCVAQNSGSSASGRIEVASSPPRPQPMEKVFKNIQVLKGVPSTELLQIMHFMRSSLGVRCEYCHVAENGKYQLDVKKEKQRAREMIVMTRQLNQVSFGGVNVITCNTCHRGSVMTTSVPEIGSPFMNVVRREPEEPVTSRLPRVPEVFARYQAATHISALSAVHLQLEGWHMKVADAGTPRARAIARAATVTGEDLIDGDKALARSPLPSGEFMLVGSNGKRAWTFGPDGLHWIPDSDFAQFQRKLNPLLVLRIRADDFVQTEVSSMEMIGAREAYVVTATGMDGTQQKLWFAVDDGLLLRRTFYHPIALGLDPEQFDFSAYKSYDGIQLPSQINASYLDDQHLGVLKKIIEIKFNVPVSDRDFMPPDK